MNLLPSWTRFWWVVPMGGLLAWALILRGDLAGVRADLSAEQFAHQRSAMNWQLATATALVADLDNRLRVERAQAEESRRIADDYEARISDARARAATGGMRQAPTAADHSGGRIAPVSGVPDPARVVDAAAGQDRLSGAPALGAADALIATEQAIQLDELINWVAAQIAVASNKKEPSGE